MAGAGQARSPREPRAGLSAGAQRYLSRRGALPAHRRSGRGSAGRSHSPPSPGTSRGRPVPSRPGGSRARLRPRGSPGRAPGASGTCAPFMRLGGAVRAPGDAGRGTGVVPRPSRLCRAPQPLMLLPRGASSAGKPPSLSANLVLSLSLPCLQPTPPHFSPCFLSLFLFFSPFHFFLIIVSFSPGFKTLIDLFHPPFSSSGFPKSDLTRFKVPSLKHHFHCLGKMALEVLKCGFSK